MSGRNPAVNRERIIIHTSFVGILTNIALASLKAAVGLLSHSIAIILDAVNNLSDAVSSVVTMIGARLAARKPDKKHPLGHGRIEYLSAMIVAALVIYAGITALIESIKKIISPEAADYSPLSLILIAVAIAAKIILGRYVKRKGLEANSASLVASGQDALSDAVLSSSVLVTALIFLWTGVGLEAYVGVIIAVFIIKAGYEILSDTLTDILGSRPNAEITESIKKTIREDPEVLGVYDLILHNYGPDKVYGSVHVELPAYMTAEQIDTLARRITMQVLKKHNVVLAAIGVYAVRQDEKTASLRQGMYDLVTAHPEVLQTHGFYLDESSSTVTFDMIIDYDIRDRQTLYNQIVSELESAYPDYKIYVTMDIDV